MRKTILFISVFFVGCIFYSLPAQAAAEDLIISEVMYDWPGGDVGHEWVEVYNGGTESVMVATGSGQTWRFFDGANHVLNLAQGSTTIATQEFFIIADNAGQFLLDYPQFVGTVFDTSMSLSNSVDDLALSADGGSTYFAQTNYSSSYGAAGTGNSLEKINLTNDDGAGNWQESSIAAGTPGLVNSDGLDLPDILPPLPMISCPQNLAIEEPGTFSASSSTDPQNLPLAYLWDFGDSATSSASEVEHAYSAAGDYQVSLTVSNGNFEAIASCSVSVGDSNEEENDDPLPNGENDNNGSEAPLWTWLSISEFLPNPVGSDTGEWIELYNNYFQAIDLTGYKLQDNSARIFTISEDDNLSILAGGYFVLDKNLTGISLNNTGGDAVKFYNPDEELIEQISYNDTALEGKSYARQNHGFVWSSLPTPGATNQFLANQPPQAIITAPKENLSANKAVKLSAENSADPEEGELTYTWDFGDDSFGDEKNENHLYPAPGSYLVKLTVTDNQGLTGEASLVLNIAAETDDLLLGEIQPINFTLNDLLITEFMPNPAGSDDAEWIELYNNFSREINLKGWRLDDSDGGSQPHVFTQDFILSSGEFKIIDRSENKLTLNNKQDSVRLLTPTGEVWQEVSYENIPEGFSYAWDLLNQEWFVNDQPSPAQANFYVESTPTVFSVSEVQDLEKKTKLTLQGIVLNTVASTDASLYLADFDGQQVDYGQLVEIYSAKKDFPKIQAGDLITVDGEISLSGKLPRIKIKTTDDIIINDYQLQLAKPETIITDDLHEDSVGQLLTIKGTVVKKSGKNIYLAADVDQEPKVRIYSKFDLGDLAIKKGMEIVVSGLLTATDSIYKLTPFTVEDILVPQVLGVAMAAEEESAAKPITSNQINQVMAENRKKMVGNILKWLTASAGILLAAFFIKDKLNKNKQKNSQSRF